MSLFKTSCWRFVTVEELWGLLIVREPSVFDFQAQRTGFQAPIATVTIAKNLHACDDHLTAPPGRLSTCRVTDDNLGNIERRRMLGSPNAESSSLISWKPEPEALPKLLDKEL